MVPETMTRASSISVPQHQYTSPHLRASTSSAQRQASDASFATLDSQDYATSTSTIRRQDARDIFQDFGIDRPSGWLSDDEDMGRAVDGAKSTTRTVRVCHSCGVPVTSRRRFCKDCGHSTCVKCTSEVPGQDDDEAHEDATFKALESTGRSGEAATFSAAPQKVDSVHSPSLKAQSSRLEPSFEVNDFPRAKPADRRSPPPMRNIENVKVRNNPFVVADQKLKSALLKPQVTERSVRASKASGLSDCVPKPHDILPEYSATAEYPSNSLEGEENVFGIRAGSSSESAVKPSPRGDDQGVGGLTHFEDILNEPQKEEPHCQSMNSLEEKIDKMYHHAQDLQQAQHILEHLALGSASAKPSGGEANASRIGRSSTAQDLVHPRRSRDGRSGRETASISPSAGMRAQPHSISLDPMVRVNTLKKSHTLRKDMVSQTKEWSLPHTLSFEPSGGSRSGASKAPRARLRSPPDWLANVDEKPGNALDLLKKARDRKKSPLAQFEPPEPQNEIRGPLRVVNIGSENDEQVQESIARAENALNANESAESPKPRQIDSHRQLKHVTTPSPKQHQGRQGQTSPPPWQRKSLKRVERSDEPSAPRRAGQAPSSEFGRHLLRKVPDGLSGGTGDGDVGRPISKRHPGVSTLKGAEAGPGCINCNPESPKAPKPGDKKGSQPVSRASNEEGTEGSATPMGPAHGDKDELFLPYKPQVGSVESGRLHTALVGSSTRNGRKTRTAMTVAEVEHALASDSSIHKASISTDKQDDLEILSPLPIMPPNHACSWKDRYLNLTAEVRLLKAEMASRDTATSTAMEMEMDLPMATADAGVSADEWQEDESGESLGIEGLTIVVHMKGRDDLVINTDLMAAKEE